MNAKLILVALCAGGLAQAALAQEELTPDAPEESARASTTDAGPDENSGEAPPLSGENEADAPDIQLAPEEENSLGENLIGTPEMTMRPGQHPRCRVETARTT